VYTIVIYWLTNCEVLVVKQVLVQVFWAFGLNNIAVLPPENEYIVGI
jgi:hypothetical protein